MEGVGAFPTQDDGVILDGSFLDLAAPAAAAAAAIAAAAIGRRGGRDGIKPNCRSMQRLSADRTIFLPQCTVPVSNGSNPIDFNHISFSSPTIGLNPFLL
jgi:hypothetical protein